MSVVKKATFIIRCTPEELAALDAHAEASGLSRQLFVYAWLWGEPPEPEHVRRMREVAQRREAVHP